MRGTTGNGEQLAGMHIRIAIRWAVPRPPQPLSALPAFLTPIKFASQEVFRRLGSLWHGVSAPSLQTREVVVGCAPRQQTQTGARASELEPLADRARRNVGMEAARACRKRDLLSALRSHLLPFAWAFWPNSLSLIVRRANPSAARIQVSRQPFEARRSTLWLPSKSLSPR